MVDSDPKLAPGTVVLGRIRVEAELSVSGIGALHRGRTTSSSAPLLVRVMSSRLLMRATDAFAREMLVMRHLEHAGIIAPLDAGVEGRRAFVVYESVEGPATSKAMPLAEVARITTEVAQLLDHAHRQPSQVIHAALSTSSVVLVGEERSVRLLDLGVVQALERVGVLPGSLFDVLHPAAASPEQVSGTFPASAATDVFGLASLAYEWLTGQAPFPATNPAEADALIVSGKRPSVHDVRPEVSADVDRILAKAWSVDPRSRPHDVLTLARELAASLSRPTTPALLAGPTQPGTVITFDDEAITLESTNKTPAETDEPSQRVQRPKVERAMTLPFGLPTPVNPSDFPPPGEKTTVPKIIAAKAPAFDLASEPPPPAEPAAGSASHASGGRAREGGLAPLDVRSATQDPDVKTVRVVSVTGLLVALIISGAMIVSAAFFAGSGLVARRAPNVVPPAVTTPAPAPSPEKSVTPEATSVASVAKSAEPVPVVASVAVAPSASTAALLWPDMPKEPGPRPSAKAMDHLKQRLRAAFEPCLKIPPRITGVPWMVHFELDGPTGQPALVEISKPFKGTLAGACMTRAALDAKVPPFDTARWAIDIKFGP